MDDRATSWNGKIILRLVFGLFLSGFFLSAGEPVLAQANGPDAIPISPNTQCTDLTGSDASHVRNERNLAGRAMRDVVNEIERIVDEIVSLDSRIRDFQEKVVRVLENPDNFNFWGYFIIGAAALDAQRRVTSVERTLESLNGRRFAIESQLAQLESSYAFALAEPRNYPDEIAQYAARRAELQQQLSRVTARIPAVEQQLEQARARAAARASAESQLQAAMPPVLEKEMKVWLEVIGQAQARREALIAQIPALKARAGDWLQRYNCIKKRMAALDNAEARRVDGAAAGHKFAGVLDGTFNSRCNSAAADSSISGRFRIEVRGDGQVTGSYSGSLNSNPAQQVKGRVWGGVEPDGGIVLNLFYERRRSARVGLSGRLTTAGDRTRGSGIVLADEEKQCQGTWQAVGR